MARSCCYQELAGVCRNKHTEAYRLKVALVLLTAQLRRSFMLLQISLFLFGNTSSTLKRTGTSLVPLMLLFTEGNPSLLAM